MIYEFKFRTNLTLRSFYPHNEKSSRWLWKEKLCQYWCEKARKHLCVTDRHDMTLAVKVALNTNTTNQPTIHTNNMKSAILR